MQIEDEDFDADDDDLHDKKAKKSALSLEDVDIESSNRGNEDEYVDED